MPSLPPEFQRGSSKTSILWLCAHLIRGILNGELSSVEAREPVESTLAQSFLQYVLLIPGSMLANWRPFLGTARVSCQPCFAGMDGPSPPHCERKLPCSLCAAESSALLDVHYTTCFYIFEPRPFALNHISYFFFTFYFETSSL